MWIEWFCYCYFLSLPLLIKESQLSQIFLCLLFHQLTNLEALNVGLVLRSYLFDSELLVLNYEIQRGHEVFLTIHRHGRIVEVLIQLIAWYRVGWYLHELSNPFCWGSEKELLIRQFFRPPMFLQLSNLVLQQVRLIQSRVHSLYDFSHAMTSSFTTLLSKHRYPVMALILGMGFFSLLCWRLCHLEPTSRYLVYPTYQYLVDHSSAH